MDRKELTDRIYDALLHNTQHARFDIDKVDSQQIDANEGVIQFTYEGTDYVLTVEEDRTFTYHVGEDYIHVYDNKDHDHSGNPFATVNTEADAIRH